LAYASLGLALLTFVLGPGMDAIRMLRSATAYPQYWRERAQQPAPPDAIKLVALGGSEVLAIGADRPELGFVGRIADHVAARTGRPVHVTNVSAGGATTGRVVTQQLPLVDLDDADLVIFSATSNDVGAKVPLDQFRADVTALLTALPAGRTVLSDTPTQSGHEPYQAVYAELADQRHFRRADFARMFGRGGEGHRLDIFAIDFHHLNTRGYEYWFKAFQPQVDAIIDGW
jgi:lysophospholipase L1-like esterase